MALVMDHLQKNVTILTSVCFYCRLGSSPIDARFLGLLGISRHLTEFFSKNAEVGCSCNRGPDFILPPANFRYVLQLALYRIISTLK